MRGRMNQAARHEIPVLEIDVEDPLPAGSVEKFVGRHGGQEPQRLSTDVNNEASVTNEQIATATMG